MYKHLSAVVVWRVSIFIKVSVLLIIIVMIKIASCVHLKRKTNVLNVKKDSIFIILQLEFVLNAKITVLYAIITIKVNVTNAK